MYIETTTETVKQDKVSNRLQDRGLGRTAPAVPACMIKPKWLPRLKHYCLPMKPKWDRTSNKLVWASPISAVELKPEHLNPGFFFTNTHSLAFDTALDTELNKLIAKLKAKQAPFNVAPYIEFINKGGRIKVALVDLSNDIKLTYPGIAEVDSTHRVLGGSLAKIGLLYAAYQHQFDMNVEGKATPESFSPGRQNSLKSIYNISPPLIFSFNNDFRNALDNICSNCSASRISRTLGLGYLNSALWQSGLYDCHWGGIWLGAHFNEFDSRTGNWECDKDPYFYKDNCTATGCHTDPKGGARIIVTALSVTTFFTLLAQDRLVDAHSSAAVRSNLTAQMGACGSSFKRGLVDTGRIGAGDSICSKIGVTSTVSHEGALITKSSGKKYVAVVLIQCRPGDQRLGSSVRYGLIEHLDKLIEANP